MNKSKKIKIAINTLFFVLAIIGMFYFEMPLIKMVLFIFLIILSVIYLSLFDRLEYKKGKKLEIGTGSMILMWFFPVFILIIAFFVLIWILLNFEGL